MPISTYSLAKLSPASQKVRTGSVITERKLLKTKLETYESKWRHKLSDEQSLQLAKIMRVIDVELQDDLEKVLKEAEKKSKTAADQLRQEWEQDKRDHLDFWKDEAENGYLCV